MEIEDIHIPLIIKALEDAYYFSISGKKYSLAKKYKDLIKTLENGCEEEE